MELAVNEEEDEESRSRMKERILDCVAHSNGFFKSQQIGDSDLTFAEKREIASDVLHHNMPLFLQRYWKYVNVEDIDYFNSYQDYEAKFYIQEILRNNNVRSSKARIRNRRYEALKKLVDESSYFSDAEMKKRNPFLYEQLIGQYLTENERIKEYRKLHENDRFSNFLMGQFERNVENRLYDEQKEEDDAEEEDDDDTEESENESELEDDVPPTRNVTKQEQSLLRREFTNIMYEHFLAGKDQEFDYSSVDNNDDYDSVDQRNIDEEEKYFDGD
uniref:Coiled-coil domain-containing protein 97 n=1 Tax=Parasteatoda tepidariorum TaxID=114398 RepID=A0A2L2YN52_PARTP